MTDDNDGAVALALLTEPAESRFRCVAPDELSQSERNASALLQLLAVLKEVGLEDDEYGVANKLADVTPGEMTGFELALKAVEETRWHRALGISARVLLRQLEATSRDDRVIELLLRIERYGRLVSRLLFWNGDIVRDIEKNLTRYLDNQRDVPRPRPGDNQSRRRARGRPGQLVPLGALVGELSPGSAEPTERSGMLPPTPGGSTCTNAAFRADGGCPIRLRSAAALHEPGCLGQ